MAAKSITDQIRSDLGRALKTRDQIKVSTLRLLLSALYNAEIKKRPLGRELSDEDAIKVVEAEIKQRKESIEAFKLGRRADLVKKEKAELSVLEKYLPPQLKEGELKAVITQAVAETGAKSMKDLGRVMGVVMGKVKGRANGGRVSEMVRIVLGGQG